MNKDDHMKQQIKHLKEENTVLKKVISDLHLLNSLAIGMLGEQLVADLTGGVLTSYSAKHDVTVLAKNWSEVHIEVKTSKINHPKPGQNTRRWNSRPEYSSLELV